MRSQCPAGSEISLLDRPAGALICLRSNEATPRRDTLCSGFTTIIIGSGNVKVQRRVFTVVKSRLQMMGRWKRFLLLWSISEGSLGWGRFLIVANSCPRIRQIRGEADMQSGTPVPVLHFSCHFFGTAMGTTCLPDLLARLSRVPSPCSVARICKRPCCNSTSRRLSPACTR